MQENPSAKTVRGLGIAVIILAACGIVACIAASIGIALLSRVIDTNSEEIAGYIGEINYDEIADIDLDDEDFTALANGLEALGGFDDDKAQGLIDLLTLLESGDADAVAEALFEDDGTLEAAVDSFSALSDEQITEFAQAIGEDPEELIKARDVLNVIGADTAGAIVENLPSDTVDGANLLLTGLGYALVAFELVCTLVALAAGILAVRRSTQPNRLSSALVMSVVAAVLALLSGRWVSMILLIIMSVFIGKMHGEAKRPQAVQAAPATAAAFPSPTAPAGPDTRDERRV